MLKLKGSQMPIFNLSTSNMESVVIFFVTMGSNLDIRILDMLLVARSAIDLSIIICTEGPASRVICISCNNIAIKIDNSRVRKKLLIQGRIQSSLHTLSGMI